MRSRLGIVKTICRWGTGAQIHMYTAPVEEEGSEINGRRPYMGQSIAVAVHSCLLLNPAESVPFRDKGRSFTGAFQAAPRLITLNRPLAR